MSLYTMSSGKGLTSINGINYMYRAGNFSIVEPYSFHDEHPNEDTDVLFIGFNCNNIPLPIKNGFYMDTPQNSILLMQKLKGEMLDKNIFYEFKLEIVLRRAYYRNLTSHLK